jgi:hypothetical protein
MRGTTGIFLSLSHILFCLQLNMGAEMQISFLLIKIYRYLLFFGHFCFDMVYAKTIIHLCVVNNARVCTSTLCISVNIFVAL